jgi:hypothetical protein
LSFSEFLEEGKRPADAYDILARPVLGGSKRHVPVFDTSLFVGVAYNLWKQEGHAVVRL